MKKACIKKVLFVEYLSRFFCIDILLIDQRWSTHFLLIWVHIVTCSQWKGNLSTTGLKLIRDFVTDICPSWNRQPFKGDSVVLES